MTASLTIAFILTFGIRIIISRETLGVALCAAIALIILESILLAWFAARNISLRKQILESVTNQKEITEEVFTIADESEEPKVLDPSALYVLLSETIQRERLFLNPYLSRQMLMDRFNLSKEKIGQAFASQGTSLPAFVNICRLEYSRELMSRHPELNLTKIASQSGFTTRESFGRSFKQQYSVTPTEYKRIAK